MSLNYLLCRYVFHIEAIWQVIDLDDDEDMDVTEKLRAREAHRHVLLCESLTVAIVAD